MSRNTLCSLVLLSIAAFPTLAIAQWQGSDFFRPPPSTQRADGDKPRRATNAIELIDKQQMRGQEAGLSLAELQRQITELKDKVTQQEKLLRVVLEGSKAEALKAK